MAPAGRSEEKTAYRGPWEDLDASRRLALSEYEDILDALEAALSEPPALVSGEMKRQNEQWAALTDAVRRAGERLSSAVRTTAARSRDAEGNGRAMELDGSLRGRISAASEKTRVLSERLRLRAAEAAAEMERRRPRRPAGHRRDRSGGSHIDIRV